MIHIYGDWYLSATANCYTVSMKTDAVDKETGETVYRYTTYHPSVSMAVQAVISRILRDEVKGDELTTLQGVVGRVESLNRELRNILSTTLVEGDTHRYNTQNEYVY